MKNSLKKLTSILLAVILLASQLAAGSDLGQRLHGLAQVGAHQEAKPIQTVRAEGLVLKLA
ncbi:MAG: hypothetical protein II698_04385, partial [Ruminococcus sp.]|nr:hypothetical protein [Ruminococcus sp.]